MYKLCMHATIFVHDHIATYICDWVLNIDQIVKLLHIYVSNGHLST